MHSVAQVESTRLVDGFRLHACKLEHERVIDGDARSAAIAAASVIAKVTRDRYMRRVAPLYGHVDPRQHRPADPVERFAADLSYLGTYAADRQAALEALFIEPARLRLRLGTSQTTAATAAVVFKRKR